MDILTFVEEGGSGLVETWFSTRKTRTCSCGSERFLHDTLGRKIRVKGFCIDLVCRECGLAYEYGDDGDACSEKESPLQLCTSEGQEGRASHCRYLVAGRHPWELFPTEILARGVIQIERMDAEDIDEVVALGLATPEFQTGTEAPQFYSKETLTNWVDSRAGTCLLVALVNGEFAGFSISSYNPHSRDGYLHCSAVVEKFRRRGIRSRMLGCTLTELKQLGCNNVFCLVHPNNEAALALFKKHGFEIGSLFRYVQRGLP